MFFKIYGAKAGNTHVLKYLKVQTDAVTLKEGVNL